MKLSSALLLLTSAVLGVRPSSAQGEPKYFEVGTTLTLEPDVSTVPKPIISIRWKYGTSLVVDWDQSSPVYFGSFRGRTTLDPQTLRLDINRLTLADSGQFSLETDRGPVGTYEVKVVKPPPTPSIIPTNCEAICALKCTADTRDLGPVFYEWKKDEGEWTEGEELKGMKSSETPEKFSCRLKTRVGTSKASIPMVNPLYSVDVLWIVLMVIIVLLVAVCAGLIAMVYKYPEHWFSIWLKKLIPCIKQGEAINGKNDDQPNEAVVNHSNHGDSAPLSPSSGSGDVEARK